MNRPLPYHIWLDRYAEELLELSENNDNIDVYKVYLDYRNSYCISKIPDIK